MDADKSSVAMVDSIIISDDNNDPWPSAVSLDEINITYHHQQAFESLNSRNGQVSEEYTFAWYDEMFIVISMIVYLLDIGTDCYLAYRIHIMGTQYF